MSELTAWWKKHWTNSTRMLRLVFLPYFNLFYIFSLHVIFLCIFVNYYKLPGFQSNAIYLFVWRTVACLNFISLVSMSLYLALCTARRKLETIIHGLLTNIVTPILTFWQYAKTAHMILQPSSLLNVVKMVLIPVGMSLLFHRNQKLVCSSSDFVIFLLIIF